MAIVEIQASLLLKVSSKLPVMLYRYILIQSLMGKTF